MSLRKTAAGSSVFRRVLGWSLILALAMCVIVWLQSTSRFDWMVVGEYRDELHPENDRRAALQRLRGLRG